jgi:hypothetical protein
MPTLRIKIAGQWGASEFAGLFGDVQFLADVAAFSEMKLDGQSSVDLFTRRSHRRASYYDYFGDVRDELRDKNLYKASRLAVQAIYRYAG